MRFPIDKTYLSTVRRHQSFNGCYLFADLQQLIAGVSSNDRAMQRESTVKFRKLLSIGARRE